MAYYHQFLTFCEVAYNDPGAVYCFHPQRNGHGYPVLNNLQNCSQCQEDFLRAGFRLKLNKCKLDSKPSNFLGRPKTTDNVQYSEPTNAMFPQVPTGLNSFQQTSAKPYVPHRRCNTVPTSRLLKHLPPQATDEKLQWVEALNCWIPENESQKQIPYITFVNTKPIASPPDRSGTFSKHTVFRRQLQTSKKGDDAESVASSQRSAPPLGPKQDSAKDSGIDVDVTSPIKSANGNRVHFADDQTINESLLKPDSQSGSRRLTNSPKSDLDDDLVERLKKGDGVWMSPSDAEGDSDNEVDPLDRMVSVTSGTVSAHDSERLASLSTMSRHRTPNGSRHSAFSDRSFLNNPSEHGDANRLPRDEGVFSAPGSKLSQRGTSASSRLSEVTPIDSPIDVQRRTSVPILPEVNNNSLANEKKKKFTQDEEDEGLNSGGDLPDGSIDVDKDAELAKGGKDYKHPAEKALEIIQLLDTSNTIAATSVKKPKPARKRLMMFAPPPLPTIQVESTETNLNKDQPKQEEDVELEQAQPNPKPPLEAKKKTLTKRNTRTKLPNGGQGTRKGRRRKIVNKEGSQDEEEDAEVLQEITSDFSEEEFYHEEISSRSRTPSLPSVQITEPPELGLGVSSQSDNQSVCTTPPAGRRKSIQKKVRIKRESVEKPETPPLLRRPPPPKPKKKSTDWIFDDSDDDLANLPAIVQKAPTPESIPPSPPAIVIETVPTPTPPGSPEPETVHETDSQDYERLASPALSGSEISESESVLNERMKRWGEKKLDRSVFDDIKRQERAEERRRKAHLAFEKRKGKKAKSITSATNRQATSFDDYNFLNKYCIFNKGNIEMFRKAFDAVDDEQKGFLTNEEVLVAMKGINRGLTDAEERYLYRVLELTGYKVEHGADFRLFSVIGALSLRIASLDEWMKNLIGRLDFKMLDMKLFKCKTLWECNVDPDTNNIPLHQLCVELRAGGISRANEEEVRRKLNHLHALDLLDFLTYVPLFIMIHESVVENPLDTSRTK